MTPSEPGLLLRERLYELAVRTAAPLAGVAGRISPKVARGVEGRRDVVERLRAWAEAERDASRPLAWVHAPSLGEGLMAQAILAELRRARPEAQVLFTHFSPSAERLRDRMPADAFEYLPWDARPWLRPVMEAVRPALVAFVRTDVWPVLSAEARRAGASLALVNAVLGPGSSRLGPGARILLRPAHGRLSAVGAVDAEDAARFRLLGIPSSRLSVTGDARFDQVWARLQRLDRSAPLLARLRDPAVPALVAGSTWPEDEERLVPALAPLVAAGRLRLILAPHEPVAAHLEGLEARLREAGIAAARLAEVERGPGPLPPAVLVDRVGVLADLYAAGVLAYVGGGFGGSGLHSVVEPAALGIPVLFGPHAGNAREAKALERERGGFRLHDQTALAARVRALLEDEASRRAAGGAAERFVRQRLGGARANAEVLAALLEEAPR